MDIEKRSGTFKVSRKLIDTEPDIVQQVMARCIPVRAECLYEQDVIKYHAYSPEFEVVPLGNKSPEYFVEVTMDETGTVSIMFKRLD